MKHIICTALCAAGLAVATPASATSIVVTYSGKVNQGVDYGGLFGGAGANLKKKAYSLSFTTDTSGFYADGIDGEYAMIQYCCTISAVMTIGEQSYSIAGSINQSNLAQWAFKPSFGYSYQINAEADATNGDWASAGISSLNNFFGELGLLGPFSHDVSIDDDYATASFTGGSTVLDLKVSNVSVEVFGAAAALPEPGSWAMMIGGFGAIGATLRRSRRTTFA